jgi:hypothetical protein
VQHACRMAEIGRVAPEIAEEPIETFHQFTHN